MKMIISRNQREDMFNAMEYSLKMSIHGLAMFKENNLLEFIQPMFDFF